MPTTSFVSSLYEQSSCEFGGIACMFNFVNSLHFIHFNEIIVLIFDLISSSSTTNGPPNGADRKVEKIDAIVSDI